MSSKFSRIGRLQKPPGICRKPPQPPPYVPPILPEQPLQGTIDFWAPFSPYEGGLSMPFIMTPDPPYLSWSAKVVGNVNEVRLQMWYMKIGNYLNFELECYSGGVFYDLFHVDNVQPATWSPFATRLLSAEPGPPGGHLRFTIWS